MRSILHRAIILLVLITMTATAAFARDKRAHVTFAEDTLVSGTLVKKGNYQVKFDQAANELLVLKNGRTVAQAPASLERRDKKAPGTELQLKNEGSDFILVGVAFGGSHELVVLNS